MRPLPAPRAFLAVALALALAAPAVAAGRKGAPQAPREPFEGRVVRVLDGDTLEVLVVRGEERFPVRVRLHGVDCPEKKQPFGQRAKTAALELAGGKRVRVVPRDRDRYGRTIGEVGLPDGRSLNHELLRLGLAWWYRRYAPGDAELEALEAEARAKKAGLWAEPGPQAPWEFRKARRSAAPATRRKERR